MNFKAILFDLDGTLLNTLEDLADSVNASLQRFGFPTHPVAAYRYFVGDGLMNTVFRALPENHRDEATLNLVSVVQREEYSHSWSKTHVYEGVPELLDALERRELSICILSNKSDDFTRAIVQRFLGKWKFAAIHGESKDFPIKPDPLGARQIARELGISPAEFLYVGDTATDMRTANAVGMFPVGVLWGFRTQHELISGGAKVLIEHPTDLLDLLKVSPEGTNKPGSKDRS
jgi:phosphoglycolate phosphatase